MYRMLTLAAGLVAVCLAGCGGGGDKPKLVPLAGRLVQNGKGLTAGVLTFHPPPGVTYNGDRPACPLGEDGEFVAKTFPYGPGAPPGAYQVTLSSDLLTRIKKPQYGDPLKTPLTVEVPDGGVEGVVLEVK